MDLDNDRILEKQWKTYQNNVKTNRNNETQSEPMKNKAQQWNANQKNEIQTKRMKHRPKQRHIATKNETQTERI